MGANVGGMVSSHVSPANFIMGEGEVTVIVVTFRRIVIRTPSSLESMRPLYCEQPQTLAQGYYHTLGLIVP